MTVSNPQRILMVGAGGVGSAAARIAVRRDFFEVFVVADYDEARARKVVADVADPRFVAARIDASNAEDVARLAREHRATHVFNAVDPRFVLPVFNGALAAGARLLLRFDPQAGRLRAVDQPISKK